MKGEVVIEPVWDDADYVHNGFVPIMRGDKLGFLDTKGEVITEPTWESARWANGGFAMVFREGKGGVINTNGETVIGLYP